MSRVKVRLADNIARVIFLESDATNGATIGTNFFLPDGTLATAASLAAYIGTTPGGSGNIVDHRLLRGLALGDDHPQYTRKDTLTARGDLYVRGVSTVERRGIGTAAQLLRSDGTDPVWATLSPVITLGTDLSGTATLTNLASATLNATIVNNSVTDAKLRDSAALSVIGRAANSAGDPADIVAGTDKDVLRRSGTAIAFGAIDSTNITDFAEAAQDAVGGILTDTPEIDFTYADATPAISAAIVAGSVAFSKVQDIATARILGRSTAGSGPVEELTGAQAASIIPVKLTGYTVATLPAGTVGDVAYVTDALAPTFGAAVTGGGAVTIPVFRNATVWVAG